MAIKVKKGPGGIKVLGGASQVNPIAREPHDNTRDLELEEFKRRSKRKFPAPDSSTPGMRRSTNPESSGPIPS